jgi:hypothetical protein
MKTKNRIEKYIQDNPKDWTTDENNPRNFKCDEKPDS